MRLKAPLYAQIEVTYGCNLACGHCLNSPRHSVSDGSTQFVSLKKEKIASPQFDAIAKRLVEWEVFSATITGGEALTAKDRMFAILHGLSKEGLSVDMNTNLNLMDATTAKQLSDGGLTAILTSLASYKPDMHDAKMGIKGAFDRTVRGVEIVRRTTPNIYLSSNMVVGKENFQDVYETGKFLASIGVQTMSIAPLTPSRTGLALQLPSVLDASEMLESLEALANVEDDFGISTRLLQGLPHCFINPHPRLQKYMNAGCDAGNSYVTIDPYGNVKPCAQIPDEFGNILRDDLKTIWERLSGYQTEEHLPETCRTCDAREVCSGGCRADAERRTGSLNSTHPFAIGPLRKVQRADAVDITPFLGREYTVRQEVLYREESDGIYTVRTRGRQYATLSSTSISFLREIQRRGSITLPVGSVANPQFTNTIHTLVTNGLLEEKHGKTA